MLTITDISIFPFEPGSLQPDLKAMAEITLNDSLTIKGIKVFEKSNGSIFIGYPAIPGKDKEYRDVVVPTHAEIKKLIRDRVVEAYKKEVKGDG